MDGGQTWSDRKRMWICAAEALRDKRQEAFYRCNNQTGLAFAIPVLMNPDMVINIGTKALEMVLWLSLPMLLVALVVGVVISLFQAVTQIQEMTLTFVPKIIAVFAALIIAAPWLVETAVTFTRQLFESIPGLIQ